MVARHKVYKALSNIYQRAAQASRQVREAFEDSWPPGGSGNGRGGGGGGGFWIGGRPALVPVRVPVRSPVRRGQRYLATVATVGQKSVFSSQAGNELKLFANTPVRISSLKHGTAFRPRFTGGTLQRSMNGYSLPGFRTRASVRYFSFHCGPSPVEVLTNLSASLCASGVGINRLAHSVNGQQEGVLFQPNRPELETLVQLSTRIRRQIATVLASEAMHCKHIVQMERVDLQSCELASEAANRMKPSSESIAADAARLTFDLSPTFAFSTINTTLTSDFVDEELRNCIERTCDDLRTVQSDICKLSQLGELRSEIEYGSFGRIWLHVYFGDRTAEQIENICRDLEIVRGIVEPIHLEFGSDNFSMVSDYSEIPTSHSRTPFSLSVSSISWSSVPSLSFYEDTVDMDNGWAHTIGSDDSISLSDSNTPSSAWIVNSEIWSEA
ncbi:uncharacterized protein V1516DRAFT_503997 [Lipomyces oligophaga]|uniref:uncharacterized protein n=1 Tax=Lipomyces oligophaga TaxID=45792 RepID=UPI0034CE55CD